MPTYDYRCESCQQVYTKMHKIADPAPQCPACGGVAKKLLSAPAVHSAGGQKSPSPIGGACGSGGCGHQH